MAIVSQTHVVNTAIGREYRARGNVNPSRRRCIVFRRKRSLGWLTAALLPALALAAPVGYSSSQGTIEVADACAQTGTCKSSPPDICFVNGVPYPNREWKSGEPN